MKLSQEFISRAESKWDEATKEMSARVGSILTGALGKRINVRLQPAEAVMENENDPSGTSSMPLKGDTSVLTAATIGDVHAIIGIDLEIARRVVERRTGAKQNTDSETADRTLTALENRLLKDLVGDLAAAAAAAAPSNPRGNVAAVEPEDVWNHRVRDELWLTTGVGLDEYSGRGIPIAGPAALFLPKVGNVKNSLANQLKAATVVLAAELGKFNTTVQNLWHIRPGTLIPIGTTVGDPLKIVIGGIPKLYGEPLVSRGNISIRLQGRIENGVIE